MMGLLGQCCTVNESTLTYVYDIDNNCLKCDTSADSTIIICDMCKKMVPLQM